MIPIFMQLFDGQGMWRFVKDFEHATLCRAFGLDQASFYFDLPSSCRGVGSNSTGNRGRRRIDGFVMRHGEPVGKLQVAFEGERFRDDDPTNKSDFYRLGR